MTSIHSAKSLKMKWDSLYINLSDIEFDRVSSERINNIEELSKLINESFKDIEDIDPKLNTKISMAIDYINQELSSVSVFQTENTNKLLALLADILMFLKLNHRNILELQVNEYLEELLAKQSSFKDDIHKTISKLSKKIDHYQQNHSDIEKFLEETSLHKHDLETAVNQVYGKENEKGEIEGGLINELKTRSKDIQTEYEKVKAVGLAGAYSDELNGLKDRTRHYNIAFYLSLIVIPTAMLKVHEIVLNIPLESFSKLAITPVVANIAFIATNFLIKLPFILPFIWFSIFLAKRRAETVRLQQEYTHKLTVAKTYISYNEQIKNLNQSDQDKLSALLLENMIQMIYHNPATTLDKQQRSDSPLEEMYNRLNKEHTYMEKIKEFFVKKDEKAESAKDEK